MIRQPVAAIRATAHDWSRAFLDLLFPPSCVGCGEPGVDWCDRCDQSLRRLSRPACAHCGSPLQNPQMECDRCVDFPRMLKVRSYAYYEGALLRAILHLKYRPNKRLAEIMAGWLADLATKEAIEADKIVPVPLGRSRLKQRGYNQVDLIADGMAKRLGIPSDNRALKRVRETQSQVGLDPIDRRINVQDAFQADQERVVGQSVFLVDDLFTTGSTLLACSRALQEAGVRKIYGLTVARA